MKIEKLTTQSLNDALKKMKVGQTCIAPDDCAPKYVMKECSSLKQEGYHFITSTKSGVQTITRLK